MREREKEGTIELEISYWFCFSNTVIFSDFLQPCSCFKSQWFHIDDLSNTHLSEFLSHFSGFLSSSDLVLTHASTISIFVSRCLTTTYSLQLHLSHTQIPTSFGPTRTFNSLILLPFHHLLATSRPSFPPYFKFHIYFDNHSLAYILYSLTFSCFVPLSW